MRSMINYFLGVVAAVFLAFQIASAAFPQATAQVLMTAVKWSAGLKTKRVETSFGQVAYLEAGRGETIVFLHGVFARKEHWIDLSRELSDDYRVVLLDLPGFGDNPPLEDDGYRFENQKDFLLEVLNGLELERFHLVANSMGAQIAAQVAAQEIERVRSLAFVGGPAGVNSRVPSDMQRALQRGVAPLVVQAKQDYHDRMAWLFPETPFFPSAVLESWAAEEAARSALNKRIWREISESEATTLLELAPSLQQPTLVFWCAKDRIFHVSGVEKLEKALPDAVIAATPECGHLPMMDQPGAVGAAYRKFLAESVE